MKVLHVHMGSDKSACGRRPVPRDERVDYWDQGTCQECLAEGHRKWPNEGTITRRLMEMEKQWRGTK